MPRIDATEILYTARNTAVLGTGFDPQTRTINTRVDSFVLFLGFTTAFHASFRTGLVSCLSIWWMPYETLAVPGFDCRKWHFAALSSCRKCESVSLQLPANFGELRRW